MKELNITLRRWLVSTSGFFSVKKKNKSDPRKNEKKYPWKKGGREKIWKSLKKSTWNRKYAYENVCKIPPVKTKSLPVKNSTKFWMWSRTRIISNSVYESHVLNLMVQNSYNNWHSYQMWPRAWLRCWPTLSCPARFTQVRIYNIKNYLYTQEIFRYLWPNFRQIFNIKYATNKYLCFVSSLNQNKFVVFLRNTCNNTVQNASALYTPTDAVQTSGWYTYKEFYSQVKNVPMVI